MNKKQVIRINENQLNRIVMESMKKILNESGFKWQKKENYMGQDELFSTAYNAILNSLTETFGGQCTVEGSEDEDGRINIIPEDGYGVSVKINYTMF